MQPWIRQYNWIKDYYKAAYKVYVDLYRAYPVTYYSIDEENTVWENDILNTGAYEHQSIGNLSGVKFKKILNVPVFAIQEIQPVESSGEETGLTYSQDLTTTITFAQRIGITPNSNDFVDLNFGFDSETPKLKPIFVVQGVNLAHESDHDNLYQLPLKVANATLNDIEAQVSSTWMYMDSTRTIVSLEIAEVLLNIEKRIIPLVSTYNACLGGSNIFLHDFSIQEA